MNFLISHVIQNDGHSYAMSCVIKVDITLQQFQKKDAKFLASLVRGYLVMEHDGCADSPEEILKDIDYYTSAYHLDLINHGPGYDNAWTHFVKGKHFSVKYTLYEMDSMLSILPLYKHKDLVKREIEFAVSPTEDKDLLKVEEICLYTSTD